VNICLLFSSAELSTNIVGHCILSTSFYLYITEKGFITKFCLYGDHIKKMGLVERKTSGKRLRGRYKHR
jgi:hypothetical protein